MSGNGTVAFMACGNVDIVQSADWIVKGGTEMDWCKALMWIAAICVFVAMVGERFLPQIVVVALAFVGTAIMVAIVAYLMDGE